MTFFAILAESFTSGAVVGGPIMEGSPGLTFWAPSIDVIAKLAGAIALGAKSGSPCVVVPYIQVNYKSLTVILNNAACGVYTNKR